MPRSFSIVTNSLDDLAGLKTTAASVGEQTLFDYEWIVVDGGSQDGTRQWLDAQTDLTWVSEPDQGIYDAMNKGLDRATGDYVIFMNAGDAFADPTVLERAWEVIQVEKEPDLLYGDSIDVLDDGIEFYRRARSHETVWLGMFTQHQAMFFHQERIGPRRYDLGFELAADYAFVAGLVAKGYLFTAARVPWPVCRYRMGGKGVQQREVALKEDHRIRRELLEVPVLSSALLTVAHWVHHLVRRRMPWLFLRLRYPTRSFRA